MPKTAPESAKITKDMRVLDIVTLVPQAADVMAQWGLHCSGCAVGGVETLESGCEAHGLTEDDISAILLDIEDARQSMPARPAVITVTGAAARAVASVAESDNKGPGSSWWKTGGLTVMLDGQGGFCMEFSDVPQEGDKTFTAAEEPSIRVYASPLTLGRIGGATIDFREGRFKLDLADDACGCTPQSCTCRMEN